MYKKTTVQLSDQELLNGKIDMHLVTKLLQSDVTTYRISKVAGVDIGNLFRLRHGEKDIRQLQIKTAYLLTKCAKQLGIK